MKNIKHEKIQDIFNSIVIYPEYTETPIKITQYSWNGNLEDFIVEYYVNQERLVFQYNKDLAAEKDANYLHLDPFEQLEQEVKYIKRMYERGIGAKECYPFTNIITDTGK